MFIYLYIYANVYTRRLNDRFKETVQPKRSNEPWRRARRGTPHGACCRRAPRFVLPSSLGASFNRFVE